MARAQGSDAERDNLAKQILAIGKRGLRRVYAPHMNPREIEIVERIVQTVEPVLYGADQARALISVFEQAIARLPEDSGKIPSLREMTLRELGEALYAPMSDRPIDEVTSYDSRIEDTRQRLSVSSKTHGRITASLRQELAKILLAMEEEASQPSGETVAPDSPPVLESAMPQGGGSALTPSPLLPRRRPRLLGTALAATVGVGVILVPTVYLLRHQAPSAHTSARVPSITVSGFTGRYSSPSAPTQPGTVYATDAKAIVRARQIRILPQPNGFRVAFSDVRTFTTGELATMDSQSGSSEFFANVNKLGGAQVGASTVQAVLQGNNAQTVQISNIEVVKECRSPLTGTLVESPGGGESQDIGIGFNLDDPSPAAQSYDASLAVQGLKPLHGSYFSGHAITLKSNEEVTLSIYAITALSDCDIRFRLTIDAPNGTTTNEILDFYGSPFRVTAPITRVDKITFAHTAYKVVYGNNFDNPGYPAQRGFARADPKKLDGGL